MRRCFCNLGNRSITSYGELQGIRFSARNAQVYVDIEYHCHMKGKMLRVKRLRSRDQAEVLFVCVVLIASRSDAPGVTPTKLRRMADAADGRVFERLKRKLSCAIFPL